MDPSIIRRASEIFDEAVDLEPVQRERIVAQRCNGDTRLLRFVSELLRDNDGAGPLDSPLMKTTAGAARTGEPVFIPEAIGPYRILRVLGEGGMGVVYEARQEAPQRTVALKILRPGVFSSELLKRFQREIHVLGRLQHPAIAHIYDAGVAEFPAPGGATMRLPYFVMELIRGEPLNTFAHRRDMPTNQRLDLVARVCDAVQYAHQRGVIHRDLKPANILVVSEDERPTEAATDHPSRDTGAHGSSSIRAAPAPKILDFGVARVIDTESAAATMNTEAGRLIGTLAYMSPEQLGGDVEQTDTRSDVYSLGVILYEVLSGKLPHDVAGVSIPEAVRRVREDEPRRLGDLDRRFRGEVELMVARAMEKNPARRYQSPADFAEDLRRYLRGEAIEARRDSAIYVLRKSLRRHRALAGAVGLLIVGMGAFAAYAFSQARRFQVLSLNEHAARVAAGEEAEKARLARDFLKRVLELANPDASRGAQLTLTDVLDEATQRLNDGALAAHPDVEAEVRQTLARTYDSLELMEAVTGHLTWLADYHRRTTGPESEAYLQTIRSLGGAHSEAGRQPQAQALYSEALELARRRYGAESSEVFALQDALGNVYMRGGQAERGLPLTLSAAEGLARLHGENSPQVAFIHFNLAGIYRGLRKPAEMEQHYLKALAVMDVTDPGSITTTRCRWGYAYDVLRPARRFDEAEPHLRETVRIATGRIGADHAETMAAERALAAVLIDRGKRDEALAILGEALQTCRQVRRWVLANEGPIVRDYANCLAAAGRPDEATAELRASIQRIEQHRGRGELWILRLIETIAIIERDRGDRIAMEAALKDMLDRAGEDYGPDDPRTTDLRRRAEAVRLR